MFNIGKLLAGFHRRKFTKQVEWEIYQKIFPHLNRVVDNGYPFITDDELKNQNALDLRKTRELCQEFEVAAEKMPAAYSWAFRYIAYQEINARLQLYIRLAKQREHHGIEETVPVELALN